MSGETDFTQDYTIGMRVYYIYTNDLTGTKELYELLISAVYPDMIIAWESRGCAHMIGAKDADNIYTERNIAEVFFKQTTVRKKFGGVKWTESC